MFRFAGRNGKTTVSNEHSRDAVFRRGCNHRVPCDLGIEVGVTVNNAWRECEAFGIDTFPAHSKVRAHIRHAVMVDGDIGVARWPTSSIEDQCVFYNEVMHGEIRRNVGPCSPEPAQCRGLLDPSRR